MSGRYRAIITLIIMAVGYGISLILYLRFNNTFIFSGFIHNEFTALIGYPITVGAAIFYYLGRTETKLDWFGKLLISILLFVWLLLIKVILIDRYF